MSTEELFGIPWQLTIAALICLFVCIPVLSHWRSAPRAKTLRHGGKRATKRHRAKLPIVHSHHTIEEAVAALSPHVLGRSGSVFYTGQSAFVGSHPLYLLGLNPGGSPVGQAQNTVGRHLAYFRSRARPWSAYADDSWEGAAPGTKGLQPRVLHMLKRLGLDARKVPASNVVFVRTPNEVALKDEKGDLLAHCWPVHDAVIRELSIRVVVCFGGTAGRWVRDCLGADRLIDSFVEQNARGWKSEAHQASDSRIVVTVTHPGRADWLNPATDPTPLVERALRLTRPS